MFFPPPLFSFDKVEQKDKTNLQIFQRRKAVRVVRVHVCVCIYVHIYLEGTEISGIKHFVEWTSCRPAQAPRTVSTRRGLEITYTTLPIVYLEKLKLSHRPKATQRISIWMKIQIIFFTAIMQPLTFIFCEEYQVWSSLREDFADIPPPCLKEMILLSVGYCRLDLAASSGSTSWIWWQRSKDPGKWPSDFSVSERVKTPHSRSPVWNWRFCCFRGGTMS